MALFTSLPDGEVQRRGPHRVQGVYVRLVLHQELEHLVSAVEGGVVQRGLVAVVPAVHAETPGTQQDPDNLRDALGDKCIFCTDS